MKTLHAMALIALAFTSMTASAIPRQDELECGLSDGSKFILEAKYDWEPLARIIPADIAERLNQGPFKVYFQPRNSLRKARVESLTVTHQSLDELATSVDLCQWFGLKNDAPYSGTGYFLPPKSKAFVKIEFNTKLVLSTVFRENPENVYLELKRLNVYPSVGAITQLNGHLVSEHALNDSKGLVAAVFKSRSDDNGKTWRDPIITTQAEIFELGKSIHEQSFIARPVKINGKKVRANFPAPAKK